MIKAEAYNEVVSKGVAGVAIAIHTTTSSHVVILTAHEARELITQVKCALNCIDISCEKVKAAS